ncbi:MAG: hypothetical protein KBC35_00230 [Candidatus Pacebacteria bacterium]|nr:hypothetical protein [Candidatus Paceibacterota bacterium]
MKVVPAFLLWVIGVFILAAFPAVTQAASLYIDPATSQLNRGDSITMAIRLDVDEVAGECINAIDGVITYTSNIEPVDISIGDSILRMWVEEPKINREAHTITFAGGIPNGYCGRVAGDPRLTNVLTEIVFQSPGFMVGGGSNDMTAQVTFGEESTAYLNDGQGTKASLTTYPAKIELASKPGPTIENPWREEVVADDVPPEEFSIMLQNDDHAFSQKYFIAFSTTDKQTGIDHYEVMEEPLTQFGSFQWGRADAPWVEARSPYVLEDQSLGSIIRVKAIDKAGNEYIATLIPDETMRTLSRAQVYSILLGVGGGVLLLVIFFVALRFKRRKQRSSSDIQEEINTNHNDHE